MRALSDTIINPNWTTIDLHPMCVVLRLFGISKVLHINEAKTPRIPGNTVVDNGYIGNFSVTRKYFIEILLGSIDRQPKHANAF